MLHRARDGRDDRGLGHEERAGDTRALSVVGHHEVRRDVLLGRAQPRERAVHDAVCEAHVPDHDGAKEGGGPLV